MYVVGAEQKQHFQMVFAAAKSQAFSMRSTLPNVPFGLVLGSDEAQEQSGGAIRLLDLLQKQFREHPTVSDHNPGMESSEIESIAKSIGIGAVKYSDAKADRTDYVFDWERMLSFEGETGPYLQCAARIRSILARSGSEASVENQRCTPCLQTRKLAWQGSPAFPDAVDSAAFELAPQDCKQLHRISQAFGSFYEHCPVLIEDASASRKRLSLCALTGDILQTGLGLLGIDAPPRM